MGSAFSTCRILYVVMMTRPCRNAVMYFVDRTPCSCVASPRIYTAGLLIELKTIRAWNVSWKGAAFAHQIRPLIKTPLRPIFFLMKFDSINKRTMKNNHVPVQVLFAVFMLLWSACGKDEPTPEPTPGDTLTIDTIPHDFFMPDTSMVLVKGGKFKMGSNNGAFDEKPVHEVEVSDFFISKYELTEGLWRRIMKIQNSSTGGPPKKFYEWSQVTKFIDTLRKITGLNYRLPTEAEWEYAARGGRYSKGFLYSGSNVIDSVGWYIVNSTLRTSNVGKLKPNELGLYDMTGNAMEWCSDWWDPSYYGVSAKKNPKGPERGLYHVLRGGHYRHRSNECRVTVRHSEQDINLSEPDRYGIRLVIGKN